MAGLPQIKLPENLIHLGVGQPGMELLPLDPVRDAAASVLNRTGSDFLAYGATRGNPGFREALASFLKASTGTAVAPDQLLITNGNSQALDLICTRFTRPGDTVLVEAPSYFLALRIFEDRGLNLVPVPMDDQGLRVDCLEEILDTCSPAFLYTIPFFHNPTGLTLSAKRQEALAEAAGRRNLLIVADEVYWFLHFSAPPPPSLGRLWDKIPVLSLGSFSKILAPGLRLGWIHGSPETVKGFSQSGLLQSGGGLNPFTSAVVEEVIRTGGLQKQIQTYRRIYGRRAGIFCDLLKEALPSCVDVTPPDGGFFVWLEFPEKTDFVSLRKGILSHDVDIHPGSYFDPQVPPAKFRERQSRFSSCMRLSFSLYAEQDLKEGTARLGRALRALLPDLYR